MNELLTKTITPFSFDNQQIRTVVGKNNEPWFVAKDVAEVLGYSNTNEAIKRHCKGVAFYVPLQTAGGMQETRIINEPDMHRLILGSTLPAAEKFERWVFEEVLPAIRKTGSYSIQNQFNIPTTYAGAMRLAADQAEQIEQQQLLLSMSETLVKQAIAETNEVLEKVSDFKDKRGCGKTYATINEVVKATGITYTYGPLKRWCIKNKIDRQEVYLTTEVFTHSYPAGAWRAAYGLDIDLLFETV